MDILLELERLAKLVTTTEERIKIVQYGIDSLDRDMEALVVVQSKIEENLSVLRSKEVTIILCMFKKALEDLGKVKINLMRLRKERSDALASLRDCEKHIADIKRTQTKLIQNSQNKILPFVRKLNG